MTDRQTNQPTNRRTREVIGKLRFQCNKILFKSNQGHEQRKLKCDRCIKVFPSVTALKKHKRLECWAITNIHFFVIASIWKAFTVSGSKAQMYAESIPFFNQEMKARLEFLMRFFQNEWQNLLQRGIWSLSLRSLSFIRVRSRKSLGSVCQTGSETLFGRESNKNPFFHKSQSFRDRIGGAVGHIP